MRDERKSGEMLVLSNLMIKSLINNCFLTFLKRIAKVQKRATYILKGKNTQLLWAFYYHVLSPPQTITFLS